MTRPIGSGLTAAEAVEAIAAWSQFGFDQRFTPLVVNTPTPTSYLLTVTPVLDAGLYAVSTLILVTGSAAGTDLQTGLEIDGVPAGPPVLSEANINGGGFLFSGTIVQDWTAGDATHTLEFLVAQPGGPGQVTAEQATFIWERKA